MRKISKLKILTVVLMTMIILFSAKFSFAQTITSIGNGTGSLENSTGNNNVNTSINNVTPTNNTNNNLPVNNTPVNNTVLPDTGAASTAGIFVLMTIAGVSATYTFIKIRKYNI